MIQKKFLEFFLLSNFFFLKFFFCSLFLLEIFFGLQNFSSKNFLSKISLTIFFPKSENDKKITKNEKKNGREIDRREPLPTVNRKLAIPVVQSGVALLSA